MKLNPYTMQASASFKKRNPDLFPPIQPVSGRGVEHEIKGLHEPIMAWCNEQHPKIPFIRSRSDCQSTIAEGAQDFTVFYRGKAICVECKSKTGKLNDKQTEWAYLMHLQGCTVHIVRSLAEFHALVSLFLLCFLCGCTAPAAKSGFIPTNTSPVEVRAELRAAAANDRGQARRENPNV